MVHSEVIQVAATLLLLGTLLYGEFLVAYILYHKKATKAIFPQAWLIVRMRCPSQSDCNIWNSICGKIQRTLITFV